MTKHIWIIAAALASLAPGAALAQQHAQQQQQPGQQQGAQGPKIELPPGAKMVATVEIDQVRAFPEQKTGKTKMTHEEVTGVQAIDRVYQTDRPYDEVVSYFDKLGAQSGNTQRARDTTQTSTAWNIALPHGRMANIIVRNTNPTTFEIISASDVVAEIKSGATEGK